MGSFQAFHAVTPAYGDKRLGSTTHAVLGSDAHPSFRGLPTFNPPATFVILK